ncbi:alcohol dehydrogenase catalytic domain-containing protein [Liquorilactobacillus satsumensis]|uniref:Threonine dehydrogenase or related Zn-dependent dehydrogenase n=1 Tax=Liquorilactobacillus satsumensis DSM 16230 = JCM 12392 TaxID=1423801 RepID=A0A0R1V0R6_9LACO|nr:alcohol dehydrogenase catalytic domain-containing protein [Liquorilactobacillus satsumensis]KRL99086.1 threonine dehydrogenase or related Zn-dependent dehydrogenase [Liquorilactobacillus satsumensis DSM 16230 = JCM 12392]MCP9312805.1 alcohol dehydrogenase catalytic domain-containing protein [Liquorilactobacillus satsumensis]MCP9329211.1 alcohol dehydrogenase catalytic domain-containing protein [Liquorilactobacillus satsumensis]MCP9359899.1 alcohol dehydrogenase catalytic domain-containing pr
MALVKAAVIYGPKNIRVEKRDIPDPGDDEVQVDVSFNGICGSDIHEYLEGMDLATVSHPLTHMKAPLIPGHEFSGTISQVGKQVSQLKIGDRVAVEPIIACGKCPECLSGHYNLCEHSIGTDNAAGFLGFSANGGLAEKCNVKAIFAHRLPSDFPLDLGALVEPVSVAAQAVLESHVSAGDDVLIQGAGPIGLFTALMVKIAGVHNIIINDMSKERLDLAKKLGILDTLHAASPRELHELVYAKTNGRGVDIAFDCAGVQPTLAGAIEALKVGGKVTVIALFGEPPVVDIRTLLKKGGSLLTSYGYANKFERVINIIDNHRELFKQVITKKIKLNGLVSEGIEALAHDKKQAKILVDMKPD